MMPRSILSIIVHFFFHLYQLWRFGSVANVVGRISEVNQRRARLVLGWVTVGRRVNHVGM